MTTRVLVVDDDPDYRLLLRLMLAKDASFEVVGEAADGIEAQRVAAELVPDLVLLDLFMPNLDGLAALPGLRAAAPDAAMIVLSALGATELRGIASAAGATGFLSKELRPHEIAGEIVGLSGVLATIGAALDSAITSLDPDLRSARAARHFVDETLRRWDCADLLDTVTLLVSELVTNAVIHAGSGVEVGATLTPDTVRVEVRDRAEATPLRRKAEEGDTSGRGLELVDLTAKSWGIDVVQGGKIIWFELARPKSHGNKPAS